MAKLKKYLRMGHATYHDFDFDELFVKSKPSIKNNILKDALKTGINPKDVDVSLDRLNSHLWYEITVFGQDKNGNDVEIGAIKDFSKVNPKDIFGKYMAPFYGWKSEETFVQRSGTFRAWKERVHHLSNNNIFKNVGLPTRFRVRVHFVA